MADHLDRDYIGAMSTVAERLTNPEDRNAADEWIAWASQYVDTIDPLQRPLVVPDDPEPTSEALRPFRGA